MLRRRKGRPATDDSNWTLRDDATYYSEQAKAAPSALRDLLSVPGTLLREARSMFADEDGARASSPQSSLMTPVEGVGFGTWVEVSAQLAHRRTPPSEADEVAQQCGVAPGVWAGAAAEWERRRAGDGELADMYERSYQRRVDELRSHGR